MAEVVDENLLYALLVEDDALQAAMAAAALTSAGFHATIVNDGTKAIDALTHKPQHLVIVDLYLPDIKGPELIKVLRSTPHGVGCKIIAVTASGEAKDLTEAFRAGADDVYQKSIGHDVLIAKFESLAVKFRSELRVERRLNALESALEENTKALRLLAERMDQSAEAVTVIGEFITTAKYANKIIAYFAAFGRFLRNFWWMWALPGAALTFIKTGIWTPPK